MSFFWESKSETSSYAGETFGFTLETYWLYTRDIQQSRGATYGTRAQPTDPEGGLHPDYFRTGRDDKNDWLQIAAFPKSSDNTTIVMIFCQNYRGVEDENDRGIMFGKQFAIPLNSGPGYLATRADDEFILASPLESSNAYGPSGGADCWGICRSDMYNLHGYTENDFVQPAQNPKEPFLDAQNQLSNKYIWTDTGCYLRNTTLSRNDTTNMGTDNFVRFTQTGGFLQSGLVAYNTMTASRDSSIYTGGNFSVYATTKQDAGTTAPVTADLGVKINSGTAMSLTNATQLEMQSDGSYDYRVWHVSGTLDVATGYDLRNLGITINGWSDFYWDETYETINGSVEKCIAYFDPWASLARPPKYSITTTNNKSIKGGIPPAWP